MGCSVYAVCPDVREAFVKKQLEFSLKRAFVLRKTMRPSNGDSTTEQQERGPCGKELPVREKNNSIDFFSTQKAQESSLPQKRTDPVLQLNNRQAVGLRQFEVGISRLDIGQNNVVLLSISKNRFSVVREPVVTT